MIDTDIIVLRKTPYSESSLLIASLSRDCGRVDFIVKGALSQSKKRKPCIDIFMELNVQFREGAHGLQPLYSYELLSSFSGIADRMDNFRMAEAIASFALKNTKPNLPMPKFYSLLRSSLHMLALRKVEEPIHCIAILSYLDEQGFLPRSDGHASEASKERALIEKLFLAVEQNKTLPAYGLEYWKSFAQWVSSISQRSGL